MPYKSDKQAKLMRAVAHGWKKPGGGGPTRAVAEKFVDDSDRKGRVKMAFGGALGMMRDPRMLQYMQRQQQRGQGQRQRGQRQRQGRPKMSTGVTIDPRYAAQQSRGKRGMSRQRPTGSVTKYPGMRGALGQAAQARQRPVKSPRRIAPPPGKMPGGQNPNIRTARNQMNRAQQRFPRGRAGQRGRQSGQRRGQSGYRIRGPLSYAY